MEDKILQGYYNLGLAVIENCFFPYKWNNRENSRINMKNLKAWKETNINFANSQFLKMICDCSDNLEYGKMKKIILNFVNKL